MSTDPSAEAFARAMLATYECPAETCGDRRVLNLTADEAMQVLQAALTRARAGGRRVAFRQAVACCEQHGNDWIGAYEAIRALAKETYGD